MIKIKKDRSNGKCTVHIDGELTIECAKDLKNVLLKAMDCQSRSLDVSKVTRIDLACLQVLWTVWSAGLKQENQIEVVGTIPEAIRIKSAAAGYEVFL